MSNDQRTEFERQVWDFIPLLEAVFDSPKLNRPTFAEVRGKIRDFHVYLENKRFGCPAGQHQGDCAKLKH